MQRRYIYCVCVCVRMCVCEHYREWVKRKDEESRGWQMQRRERKDRTPGKQSDCAAWWMLLELFLSSLSAFLFLFLSPSLPSRRLFLQTRWQHQSKEEVSERNVMGEHARRWAGERVRRHRGELPSETIYSFWTTTTSFNVWRGDDDLLFGEFIFYGWHRRGVMLMKAALLLPLITQSNTKCQQNESCITSFGTSWSIEKLTFWGTVLHEDFLFIISFT